MPACTGLLTSASSSTSAPQLADGREKLKDAPPDSSAPKPSRRLSAPYCCLRKHPQMGLLVHLPVWTVPYARVAVKGARRTVRNFLDLASLVWPQFAPLQRSRGRP